METTTGLVPGSEVAAQPVLLKTDVLGRVKHSREQRERILDEYERSGVSGPKFAALAGVKYQTFATWLQRRSPPIDSRSRQNLFPTKVAASGSQWQRVAVGGTRGVGDVGLLGKRGAKVRPAKKLKAEFCICFRHSALTFNL